MPTPGTLSAEDPPPNPPGPNSSLRHYVLAVRYIFDTSDLIFVATSRDLPTTAQEICD